MTEHFKQKILDLDKIPNELASAAVLAQTAASATKASTYLSDYSSSIDISSALVLNKLMLETSATEMLRREVEKHQELAKRLDPQLSLLGHEYSSTVFALIERARLSQIVDSSFLRHVDISRQAALSLKDFRVPGALEISRALESFGKGVVTEWLEREKSQQIQWSKQFENIQSGWANIATEARSVRAFSELQGLGAALKSFDGFEHGLVAALRLDFGDWRAPMAFDENILVEPIARKKLYVAQGFDAALTDFPEAAYSQGLALSGLSIDYYTDSDLTAFVPQDVDDEEAAAFRRAQYCFLMLHKLERRLRRFVNDAMTAKFGEHWAKHRLPGVVYSAWQEKAEKARANGETLDFLIEAADFTDYESIICRKDTFAELFKPYFRDASSVRESFNRLRPLRIATMHSRFVTKDDLLFLVAEATRLLRAMGA